MNKMIKRKKDEGFTLIELMIVIAVIGILAVVLVPKFGNIKTSAKLSGVETNFRSVTAAVQGVKLTSTNLLNEEDVTDAIGEHLKKSFNTTNNSELTNPINKSTTIINNTSLDTKAAVIVDDDIASDKPAYSGAVMVKPDLIDATGVVKVTITACDEKGVSIPGLLQIIEP